MTSDDWPALLHELDRAAWSLAAIVTAVREDDPSAWAVTNALGLELRADDTAEMDRLASTAAAPLLQASRYLIDRAAWSVQDDEALLAQGRASAAGGRAFRDHLLPQLPGGSALLERPIRMLDVGVGVAAMAVALCEQVPQLAIVGLDVLERPLELARKAVIEAGLDDRIELRLLDVAELRDDGVFDLAWLPAPFIPRGPLERGLDAVHRALRPGGWVILGHGRFNEAPLDQAVTRFKTVVYGGTPLDDDEAAQVLENHGFAGVHHLLSPPGTPAFTVGQRTQMHAHDAR